MAIVKLVKARDYRYGDIILQRGKPQEVPEAAADYLVNIGYCKIQALSVGAAAPEKEIYKDKSAVALTHEEEKPIGKMTMPELMDKAAGIGLDIPNNMRATELRQMIKTCLMAADVPYDTE